MITFNGIQAKDHAFFMVCKGKDRDILLLPMGSYKDFQDQKFTMDIFNKRGIPHLEVKGESYSFYKFNDKYKKEVICTASRADYINEDGKLDDAGKSVFDEEVYGVISVLLTNYFMSDAYKKLNIWGKMTPYGVYLKVASIVDDMKNTKMTI